MNLCKLVLLLGIVFASQTGYAQATWPNMAIDSLNKLIRIDQEDTNKVNHLVLLSREISRQNTDTAFIIANTALDLANKLNWVKGTAHAHIAIAWCYYVRGNYSKALEYNFKAIKTGEASGDKQTVLFALSSIGQVYDSEDDPYKAIEYHAKALQLAQEIHDEWSIARNTGMMGTAYQDLKKYPLALQYYFTAYRLTEKIGYSNGMAIWLSNIGSLYIELARYDSALWYLNRSAAIFRSSGNQWAYAGTILDIGKVHLTQKKYRKSFTSLDTALHISIRLGALEDQRNAYLALSNLYKESDIGLPGMNNAALLNKELMRNQALTYYQQYVAMKDSLNNREVQKRSLSLEFENKTASAKMEQEKKDAVSKAELYTQKIIRNSFIAGSLLLMLLIVVLVNRSKLKRGIELEKMRSRLSRDLHDDIGSTLSSINILSRTAQTNLKETNDEKTKASLEKINERSQRLLDSMSDIIWNINPGNDTMEEVMSRMREYATSLLEAKNIEYSFNFPKQQMDCRLSMEVKNNLYLIFKEAVNNLSKYSGCTHATLSLVLDEKNIQLTIEDNGIGFNEAELKHRGGLLNMQQRAQEIKGNISIHSVINKGTRIVLTMPGYC